MAEAQLQLPLQSLLLPQRPHCSCRVKRRALRTGADLQASLCYLWRAAFSNRRTAWGFAEDEYTNVLGSLDQMSFSLACKCAWNPWGFQPAESHSRAAQDMAKFFLDIHLPLFFFLFIFCFHIDATSTSSSPHTEAEALLSLKASVVDFSGGLASWVIPPGQSSPDVHCKWAGVACDENLSITSLNMSSMGFSGILSPSIGLLSNLVNLSVAGNHLTSCLPSEIAALSDLIYLNISNNNLSCNFPTGFSHLKSLQVLDAFNNNFTGMLPLELSLLTSLKHLHLGGNYFVGRIPPQYGNMRGLEYLALSGNALTGRIPVELGSLTELQQLYLGYYNQLEGGIPFELGRLLKLVRLDISNSGLNGSIPSVLGSLNNLDSLFLQSNGLTGAIPLELGKLRSLKSLDLSCNALTGKIPSELANLHMLELLNLFENSLQGDIPPGIADLPNLQVLKLFSNELTGVVPQHLGTNGQLIIVDLASNLLTGPIPPQICAKKALQQLILMSNGFSGIIPDALASCPKLERVRLGHNKLYGHIPSSLFLLPALNYLELVGNLLTGPIPSSVPSTSVLATLDLSHNQLTGSLPGSIGKMGQLADLDLSGNRIYGKIPEEVRHLQQLTNLCFKNNMLTDTIPSALGQCISLTSLDLSHNQLEGEIPHQLSRLSVLDSLNVSWNHLDGSIPSSFNNIVTLARADFSFNNLSGAIPSGGKFSSFNGSSFLGNPGLCGIQLQRSCDQIDASAVAKFKQQRIIISICSILVGLSCVAVAIAWCLRRIEVDMAWEITAFEKLGFSVKNVIECLTDENIISKGGSAIVYKGLMPGNQVIAIKVFSTSYKASHGGDNGFSAEIRTLGCIRHRNIVRLLGFCTNNETNLLLLEYMPNGSLGDLLHGSRGGLLDWELRYKIALDAAKGLCYLHHDHSPMIVHRDVKSNNILLDRNFEAHVADFGLAKALQDSGASESMSSVAGSYGYIAPEYAYTLRVDEKSDVYSYGVVLLELITGKRPTEPEYGDYIDIARWAKRKARTWEERMEMMDTRIDGSVKLQQDILLLLEIALRCVSNQPNNRPTMRDVVRMLTDGARVKASDTQEDLKSVDLVIV